MKSAEWTDPKGGAYGTEGYVAKFGEPEEFELTSDKTKASRRKSRIYEEMSSAEDGDDNDWTVTYTDMVTLLMAFFVMLTTMALMDKDHSNKNPDPPAQESQHQPHYQQTPQNPVNIAISPFDGQGITLIEGGHPTNIDPDKYGYETTADAGSETGDDTAPTTQANRTGAAQTRPPQSQNTDAPPQNSAAQQANTALAQRLQALVQQNNLAGQVQVVSGEASVTVRISDRILFQSGKADLEIPGQDLIARLLPMLNQPGQILSIEGHTDNIPIKTSIYPSNWELSAARAATVLRQLIALGLPADRLRAIAYADTKPVQPNDSSDHRAANRRVELVITGDTTATTQP